MKSKERIDNHFHCKSCLEQIPDDVSPRDWARINVGFTQPGLQVWCARHDKEIVHIDFSDRRSPTCQSEEDGQ